MITCDATHRAFRVSNPKEGETAKEKGLFVTLCPHFIRTAAEILEEFGEDESRLVTSIYNELTGE